MEALRATIWWDNDTQQLIVDGKAGVGIGSPRRGGIPGTMRVISNAGPGVKHDIQRALNVRNLDPKTALTQAQVSYLDFAGSYEPEPRLQDMDVQGIDQVMIIPTDIDTYPWLQNAVGAKAMCKAYNQWAYDIRPIPTDCSSLCLPMQNPAYATQELYRVAKLGCRWRSSVPRRDGQLSVPTQIRTLVERDGGNRAVYGMHPFPAFGAFKPPGYTEQYSGAELVRRTVASRAAALLPLQRAELPGRSCLVGHYGIDVGSSSGILRSKPPCLRHPPLGKLPPGRMRQGGADVQEQASIAAAPTIAARNLLRALHDWL